MKGMPWDGRRLPWHALNLSRNKSKSDAALRPQGFFNDGATSELKPRSFDQHHFAAQRVRVGFRDTSRQSVGSSSAQGQRTAL
jgi:hypothetical protein